MFSASLPFAYKAILALCTAFLVSCLSMPSYIGLIIRKTATQSINSYLEKTGDHAKKQNTPTMGGIVIVFSSVLSFFIFGDISNKLCQIVIFCGACFMLIGFIDDYAKIAHKTNKGILVKARLYMEFGASLITILMVRKTIGSSYYGEYLFIKSFALKMGFLYFLMQLFAITGSSNATNLTDGLDGLVAIPAIICLLFFGHLTCNLDILYSKSDQTAIFLQRMNELDAKSLAVLCAAKNKESPF